MVANHLRHVVAVEIVAAERAQPIAHRLLRGLERRRNLDALAAREARQLLAAADVAGHRASAERAHGRTRPALSCRRPALGPDRGSARSLDQELTDPVTH